MDVTAGTSRIISSCAARLNRVEGPVVVKEPHLVGTSGQQLCQVVLLGPCTHVALHPVEYLQGRGREGRKGEGEGRGGKKREGRGREGRGGGGAERRGEGRGRGGKKMGGEERRGEGRKEEGRGGKERGGEGEGGGRREDNDCRKQQPSTQ